MSLDEDAQPASENMTIAASANVDRLAPTIERRARRAIDVNRAFYSVASVGQQKSVRNTSTAGTQTKAAKPLKCVRNLSNRIVAQVGVNGQLCFNPGEAWQTGRYPPQ